MELPGKVDKTSFAELDVDVDNKKPKPGDHVKGDVKLKCHEDMDNCTFKITFTAREWCTIDKIGPQPEDSVEHRDITKEQSMTCLENKSCSRGGTYKFDYKFSIPNDAPAAFEASYPNSRGYIRYLLMVTFECPGKQKLIVWKKIKVKEKFPKEETLKQTAEGSVTGYCYANMGKLKMKCAVESLASLDKVDNNIEGTIDIDNRECAHTIKKLHARIAERVNMHAGMRSDTKETTIVAWELKEVKASEQKEEKFKVEIPHDERFKTLCTSRQGKLMKRNYVMTIVPEYDAFTCCVPNIMVNFAIEHAKTYKKKEHKK